MAINSNHLFEDLDGIKCAVVEKNANESRVQFIRGILEFNGYKVVVANSPPPKVAPVAAQPIPVEGAASNIPPVVAAEPDAPVNQTFTIGVTDVTFNATNAIFGRLLKTSDGHVVTLGYWQGREDIAEDDRPYFE